MSTSRTPRAAVLGLTVGALVAGGLVLAPAASAIPSTGIVISEVYGGGGNTGATLKNDFIELRNVGAITIDVSGWSVQYASNTGTSWQRTALTGSIAPGASYLVQEAAGAAGTMNLPTPDAIGTISMSGTSAKVALVPNNTPLACGTSCAGSAAVVDLVGYGTSTVGAEGTPTANLSNTTSASRTTLPDTDNNVADFTVGGTSPTNSAGISGGDATPPPPGTPATISEIQGAGHTSPLHTTRVETTGVVTAHASNGFWMQDPAGDSNPATSEGIFVFTGTPPPAPATIGTAVAVTGTVSEFRGRAGDLTVTQLGSPTVAAAATAAGTITPIRVGPGGLTPPGAVIDDDGLTTFDPSSDGADFYESLEGMLLSLDAPEVVGPTNGFGELPVVVGDASVRTPRGGIVVQDTDGQVDGDSGDYVTGDFNPERIILDDRIIAPAASMPLVNVGAVLAGTVLGVLDYGFGNPKLQVTTVPTVESNNLQREQTAAPGAEELAVATFNVENLDPTDPQEKFDGLAELIVANLQSPDLIALEEIQDDNGATNDGTVTADQTLDRLVAAIAAAGGPTYQYRQIDPENGTDGGEPGGNIRVGFLFRSDRGLAFVDRPGGNATTATGITGTGADTALTLSPGRVDPANGAWANSRKPLAGEFTYRGKSYFVIVNHFASKGGDQAVYGTNQPPVRTSEVQRHKQAAVLRDFVGQILTADPQANVIALGDINDFQFSHTMRVLEESGLQNLMETLPVEEQYSYVFDGNSQSLDHTLVSPALLAGGLTYDPVHVNSEFADQVSDHDPQVTLIDTAVAATASISDERPLRGDRVTVTASGFSPGASVKVTLPERQDSVLGTGVADANGTVNITITVPVFLKQGGHLLDVTAADGEQTTTSFTLRPAYEDALLWLLRVFGR